MCDDYAEKDSRIKVVHKKNGGLSDARNAGMAVATGEYISFIDSDDYVSDDFFECLLDVMNKENSDIMKYLLCVVLYNSVFIHCIILFIIHHHFYQIRSAL